MSTLAPLHIRPEFSRRTWGRRDLSPHFPSSLILPLVGDGEPFGEAWLTGPGGTIDGGPHAGHKLAEVAAHHRKGLLGSETDFEFPLLIKLLFPDAKLSVQVHPNDEEAQAQGIGRGKTECWYVLHAEPGATVACGLRDGVSIDQLRKGIADGSAESLLLQVPVSKGDMVFVDAGTVHAIGPGVTLLEIQQTCDTTYRLYDYGRPRELHVEQGLAVSKTETRAGKVLPQRITLGSLQATRLIQEQYFTVDSFCMKAGDMARLDDAQGKPHCFTALDGDAEILCGGGTVPLPASSSVVVPASCGAVTVRATCAVEIVRAMP